MASLSDEQKLGLLLWARRRHNTRRFRQRRWWIHPILSQREEKGEYHALVQELKLQRPAYFKEYFRMTTGQFEELLEKVGPVISRKDTTFRRCIPADERLAVALRFLATGDSYRTIANSYRLGISTVSYIIPDTCKAIWEVLQPEVLRCPSTPGEWAEIANNFEAKWQFPNCLGAIDGKHVIIQAPDNSGSTFFNYKRSHSIVLMAVVDSSYKFVVVDVGSYGRCSDGGIFANSCFGRRLLNGTLSLPSARPLGRNTDENVPFVFVADEAFPLKENLMRPYGGTGLTIEKRIFNYRLSRARRMVESTFGILANQWRIFHRVMPLQPANADVVVKAACCLHNFLRNPSEDSEPKESEDTSILQSFSGIGGPSTSRATSVRLAYTEYFNGEGAVGWQNSKI